ncbi:hypothetical protein [Frankia gtarii]|uniref:hypothetical protein n=1 Tax=Frankia gtarii TaxID=2950102 RepID=UPI0021C058AC|nr:hypothetical protein [Frankia gtarii]
MFYGSKCVEAAARAVGAFDVDGLVGEIVDQKEHLAGGHRKITLRTGQLLAARRHQPAGLIRNTEHREG